MLKYVLNPKGVFNVKVFVISPVSLTCSDNCEQVFLCVPRPWYNLCYGRRTFAVQAEIGVNEHLESLFFAKKGSRAS